MKHPFQNSLFGPAVDADIDGMPGAEGLGERPSFAAVLTDIDDGVKEEVVFDGNISPLYREKPDDFFRCSRVNFMALIYHIFLV
jgi:hypothetical protein